MEPSPKTTCTRCGTSILQITADLNDGHCMPCVKALAWESEPPIEFVRGRRRERLLNHAHPAEGVILSVAFHPGFTPDLTSWVIEISNDGALRQAVDWYRGEEELLDPVTLKPSDLAELQELVESCSPESFRSLKNFGCIDDAALVSLVMPAQGVSESLPYFHLEFDLKKGRWQLDETQAASFQLFSQLWRFADRHAPYRLCEHEKKNR